MKSSSLSRFVEAAYLYPEVGGLTHVVSSLVEGTPQHYRAKSIKHITPLKVGIEHCEHLLKVYDPSDTLAPPILKESEDGIPEGVQGEVDTAFEGKVSQGPTTDMSRVGPPAAWVREHGGTLGCPACGEKRGKANHNAACKQRYDRWLKGQRERLVAAKEPGSDGVAPELGPARRMVCLKGTRISWSCARTRTSSCSSGTWIWKCSECPSPVRREKLCGCGGTGCHSAFVEASQDP